MYKILCIELLGLGDNIHTLPTLWQIRQEHPDAQLHVMVRALNSSLFSMTPWIDKFWSYPTGKAKLSF
ncbi:MAG: glycosyltransferase family 9 protein, partial [Stenotrophobium sp.]